MTINLNVKQDEKVLNQRELAEFLGCTRVTVWKLEKEGKIPKRKQINGKSGGWLLSEIIEWFKNQPHLESDEAEK